MAKWKLPPAAKVYEALSALADGRVRIMSAGRAEVVSSAGDKVYTVEWSEDGRQITANDNASYWQGYTGYPIIATLLATGRISYDPAVAALLAGVPWHDLNEQFKREYDAVVESVLRDVEERNGDRAAIVGQVEVIRRKLESLDLDRGPRRRPPRPGSSPGRLGA